MVDALILTQEEIQQITKRQRFKAQARQLGRMGIEHRLSATGEPVVSRAHFEQVMGTKNGSGQGPVPEVKLNLSFLDNGK